MENLYKKCSKVEVDKVDEIVEILSEAFLNHQNFIYLIEEHEIRKKSLKHLFRFMIKAINKYGDIFAIYENNELIGCINYLDENTHKINLKTVIFSKGGVDLFKFIMSLHIKHLTRFYKYMKAYNKLPHSNNQIIHLYSTAIKNEYKGQGLMTLPFKSTFSHYKNNGFKKVTLETSDKSNISLYEHLGFNMISKVQTKDERQEIFFFEKVL